MSFHDRFYTDKAAKEEGTWVPLGGGIAIKVRALDSAASRELRRKLEEKFKPLMQANDGTLPEKEAEEIMLAQLAGAILIDWRGVTEEDGTVVPFSVENATRILRRYEEFRSLVIAHVTERATWKKQVREADLGN